MSLQFGTQRGEQRRTRRAAWKTVHDLNVRCFRMTIFCRWRRSRSWGASKGDTSSCMWLSDSICPSSCFSSVSRQSDMSDAKCQSDFMFCFFCFFFPFASISFNFLPRGELEKERPWRVYAAVWVRRQGRGRHAIVEQARGRLHYGICWCVCVCLLMCVWMHVTGR